VEISLLVVTVWVALAMVALGSMAASLIFISINVRRVADAMERLAQAELEEPTPCCSYCGGLRDVAVAPQE
jgi:hypothetical protein